MMNANEKQMRYQSLSQLNKLKRNGAKPNVIETLQRSMQTERGGGPTKKPMNTRRIGR